MFDSFVLNYENAQFESFNKHVFSFFVIQTKWHSISRIWLNAMCRSHIYVAYLCYVDFTTCCIRKWCVWLTLTEATQAEEGSQFHRMLTWISKVNKPRREAPRRNVMESKHTEAAPDRRAEVMDFFQIHSKGLYKHPNDSRNDSEWLSWLYDTCLRHIRNHPTTENYFLRLDFRKLSPKNELKYVFYFIVTW